MIGARPGSAQAQLRAPIDRRVAQYWDARAQLKPGWVAIGERPIHPSCKILDLVGSVKSPGILIESVKSYGRFVNAFEKNASQPTSEPSSSGRRMSRMYSTESHVTYDFR